MYPNAICDAHPNVVSKRRALGRARMDRPSGCYSWVGTVQGGSGTDEMTTDDGRASSHVD